MCNLRCSFCQNHDIAHQKKGFNLQVGPPGAVTPLLGCLDARISLFMVTIEDPESLQRLSCIPGYHFRQLLSLQFFLLQKTKKVDWMILTDKQPDELADWFLKLQEVGRVHNINLITPEHVVPQVALAIMHARDQGLTLPIIYNTSAYDSLASLELLDGLVDIYLPDFKVWEPATSKRLLKADDYAAAARESIKAMHAQVGDLCFTGDGILLCQG